MSKLKPKEWIMDNTVNSDVRRDTGILKAFTPEMRDYFKYLHQMPTPPAYRLGSRCGFWIIPREICMHLYADKFGAWQSEICIATIQSLGDVECPVIAWSYYPSNSSGITTSVELAEQSILDCHQIIVRSIDE